MEVCDLEIQISSQQDTENTDLETKLTQGIQRLGVGRGLTSR